MTRHFLGPMTSSFSYVIFVTVSYQQTLAQIVTSIEPVFNGRGRPKPIYAYSAVQRRRLVINIGLEKICVTNIGGAKFEENVFSETIHYQMPKNSSILKNF